MIHKLATNNTDSKQIMNIKDLFSYMHSYICIYAYIVLTICIYSIDYIKCNI